jgi:hypothetical protein
MVAKSQVQGTENLGLTKGIKDLTSLWLKHNHLSTIPISLHPSQSFGNSKYFFSPMFGLATITYSTSKVEFNQSPLCFLTTPTPKCSSLVC